MSYKSNYTYILPSYVCALTHFPPLPPMTTCKVIQVYQVRIFRELRTYTHSTIINILCECVTHIFLSTLPHEHLWDGLLPTTGEPGNPVPKGLTIHSTILNILCECATQYFLLPPSQTPVGRPTSYQVNMVRIPRGLATHSSILNIIHYTYYHRKLNPRVCDTFFSVHP